MMWRNRLFPLIKQEVETEIITLHERKFAWSISVMKGFFTFLM